MKKLLFFLLVLMAIPFASHAQDPQINPAVNHLMKAYRLDLAEAQSRLDRQAEIIKLSERLNTENDPAYADMYIQHEPNYRIVVMFADKKDRQALWQSMSPKIRPHVKLKTAKRSRGVANKRYEELNATLRKLPFSFSSHYDLATNRFSVTVEDPVDIELVKAVLPKARRFDTRIEVGLVPKVEALPSGVQPGDRLYGGNPIFDVPANTGG